MSKAAAAAPRRRLFPLLFVAQACADTMRQQRLPAAAFSHLRAGLASTRPPLPQSGGGGGGSIPPHLAPARRTPAKMPR